MEIDLGDKIVYKVRLGEEVFNLREPSGKEARQFAQTLKKTEQGDEIDAFIAFVHSLGMPKNIAEELGITKIKKLADGILGGVDGKK